MAAFLLVSMFPQLPLTIYLAYAQELLLPVDYIMGSIMIAFLVRYSCLAALITFSYLRLIISVSRPPSIFWGTGRHAP